MSSDELQCNETTSGWDEELLFRVLKKYWNIDNLYEFQYKVVKALLYERKNCFLMIATGMGKSLTFQLPTLIKVEQSLQRKSKPCCTIVISPLLSLIEDQTQQLQTMSISACFLGGNSQHAIEEQAMMGKYNFIYCTPEKALIWSRGFQVLRNYAEIVLLAIDEAHCVREWGECFRPEYSQLYTIRDIIGYSVPVVAVTATATQRVATEVIDSLQLNRHSQSDDTTGNNLYISDNNLPSSSSHIYTPPLILKHSINRSNIKYFVKQRCTTTDIIRTLIEFFHIIQSDNNNNTTATTKYQVFPSTLIYVNSKKKCEEIAKEISECVALQRLITADQNNQQQQLVVAYYHAGIPTAERQLIQGQFLCRNIHIIVCTSAFGMGIDKRDIQLVVHYGLPLTLEQYVQQTGRAARDYHAHSQATQPALTPPTADCHSISNTRIIPTSTTNHSSSSSGSINRNRLAIDNVITKAYCVLLYHRTDVTTCYNLAFHELSSSSSSSSNGSSKEVIERRIQDMINYCTDTVQLNTSTSNTSDRSVNSIVLQCRRKYLLYYFNEEIDDISTHNDEQFLRDYYHQHCCDLCDQRYSSLSSSRLVSNPVIDDDVLLSTNTLISSLPVNTDAYNFSQAIFMILVTIYELGQYYGLQMIINALLGRNDKSMQKVPCYQQLTYFSQGKYMFSGDLWKYLILNLHDQTYTLNSNNSDSNGSIESFRFVVSEMKHITSNNEASNNGRFSVAYQRYMLSSIAKQYIFHGLNSPLYTSNASSTFVSTNIESNVGTGGTGNIFKKFVFDAHKHDVMHIFTPNNEVVKLQQIEESQRSKNQSFQQSVRSHYTSTAGAGFNNTSSGNDSNSGVASKAITIKDRTKSSNASTAVTNVASNNDIRSLFNAPATTSSKASITVNSTIYDMPAVNTNGIAIIPTVTSSNTVVSKGMTKMELESQLRTVRGQISTQFKLPPYTILSTAELSLLVSQVEHIHDIKDIMQQLKCNPNNQSKISIAERFLPLFEQYHTTNASKSNAAIPTQNDVENSNNGDLVLIDDDTVTSNIIDNSTNMQKKSFLYVPSYDETNKAQQGEIMCIDDDFIESKEDDEHENTNNTIIHISDDEDNSNVYTKTTTSSKTSAMKAYKKRNAIISLSRPAKRHNTL